MNTTKLITNQMIELITHGYELRVSTLEIEKHSGLKHQSIIKLVRKYQAKFNEQEQVRFEISLNKSGSPTEYALLTERHTLFLYTLFRNLTPQIINFKFNLANRFYELKEMLMQRHNTEWVQHRASGKIVTKRITAMFNAALDVAGKSHESYRFSNLQQSIYKAALGKTFQCLRKERNIPKHAIIRDYLTPKELERINILQNIVEMMLDKHEHINDVIINDAIIYAGNTLQIVANCPLGINHKVVA